MGCSEIAVGSFWRFLCLCTLLSAERLKSCKQLEEPVSVPSRLGHYEKLTSLDASEHVTVEETDCHVGLFGPTDLIQVRRLLGGTLLSCMQLEHMLLDQIVPGSVLLEFLVQKSELPDIGVDADLGYLS